MSSSTWHLAGAGALGSLVTSCFVEANQEVNLILKDENQLALYQQSGLTITAEGNTFRCCPNALDIRHLPHTLIDYLICCVKAYDITPLLLQLKHQLHKNSIIILIHNGLGVLDEIQASLPELRVISGVCTLGAYIECPFTVRAFLEGRLYLGEGAGQFSTHEIDMICTTFQMTKLPFQWERSIKPMAWEKFAINCTINVLTALLSCRNGDLLAHHELLKNMTNEVAQVANSYSVNLSADQLLLKVIRVLKGTSENYSSMYKDVQKKDTTELYYLNEYLIKLAEQKKIPTPINNEMLNKFYAKYRSPGKNYD